MAGSAELFSARKNRYGDKRMSEFNRLWIEYHERFGIDIVANTDRTAFVETMRECEIRSFTTAVKQIHSNPLAKWT